MSISNFLIDFKKTIENPTLLPRVNMDLTLLINKHIENKTCIEDFNKLVIDENIRNKFTGIMICDIKKNDLQTYIQHVYTYLGICDIVEEEKNMCTIYACFLDPLDAFKYIKDIIQCCDIKDRIQYSDKKLK